MTAEVYRAEICDCHPGDVVFAVFEPNTGYTQPLHFQHAAIFFSDRPVLVHDPKQPIQVLEVTDHPDTGDWPKERYEVQIIGQKRSSGAPIPSAVRTKITLTGRGIVRRAKNMPDKIGDRKQCGWELRRYKHVAPNPNDPEVAEELFFTCAGFVEYCYEQALEDIIKDHPCFQRHNKRECQISSVPFYFDSRKKELIHRLWSGYLIRAFQEDTYPLDFDELLRAGEDPANFEKYPFSSEA